MAGYSGTPLAKKLGIKDGTKLVAVGAPKSYRALVGPLPDTVRFLSRVGPTVNLVHHFGTKTAELTRALSSYRRILDPEAVVWVSWPKKASEVPSEITEDFIRKAALPLGFVDVKVCAVDDTWSGLKLVVRKELR